MLEEAWTNTRSAARSVAQVEDCWAVCTQLTLDSPSLCDGVDYDPVTEQCFLTRSCTVENLEESLTMQHWVPPLPPESYVLMVPFRNKRLW